MKYKFNLNPNSVRESLSGLGLDWKSHNKALSEAANNQKVVLLDLDTKQFEAAEESSCLNFCHSFKSLANFDSADLDEDLNVLKSFYTNINVVGDVMFVKEWQSFFSISANIHGVLQILVVKHTAINGEFVKSIKSIDKWTDFEYLSLTGFFEGVSVNKVGDFISAVSYNSRQRFPL